MTAAPSSSQRVKRPCTTVSRAEAISFIENAFRNISLPQLDTVDLAEIAVGLSEFERRRRDDQVSRVGDLIARIRARINDAPLSTERLLDEAAEALEAQQSEAE